MRGCLPRLGGRPEGVAAPRAPAPNWALPSRGGGVSPPTAAVVSARIPGLLAAQAGEGFGVRRETGTQRQNRLRRGSAARVAEVLRLRRTGLQTIRLSPIAGFLVGMLIPSTRLEDERLGEMADYVKDKARETGQEALEEGSRWPRRRRSRS